jgi:hypothetical protein
MSSRMLRAVLQIAALQVKRILIFVIRWADTIGLFKFELVYFLIRT